MRTLRTTRAFTLIEVVIAMTLFIVVLGMVSVMLGSANDTTSLVGSMSESQLDAEKTLELIRAELRTATTDFPAEPSREISVNFPPPWVAPAPPLVEGQEVVYSRLDSRQQDLRKNIMVDGMVPEAVPWLGPVGQTRVIRFELDAGEVGGVANADDDGDLLVDEGRIALYSRTAGFGDTLIAVLARDVRDGTTIPTVLTGALDEIRAPVSLFALDPPAVPPAPQPPVRRSRLWVTVVVERPIRSAIKGPADVAALKAGNGPVKRHLGRIMISLLN